MHNFTIPEVAATSGTEHETIFLHMERPDETSMRDSPGHSVLDYRHFGAFRLLLASLVLLQHYLANLAPSQLAERMQANEIGSVAVLIFFCLSGFVISEAADRIYQNRPGAFLTNRALRIVPHFVLAVGMSILIHYVFSKAGTLRIARVDVSFSQAAFAPTNIFLNLFSFAPIAHRSLSYNFLDIAWAIRVEMVFYLAIAASLVLVLLIRGHSDVRFETAALIALLTLVPPFALTFAGRAPAMLQFLPYFAYGSALYFWAARRAPLALGFAAGALLVMIWRFLSQPGHHPEFGFERAVGTEFLELALLLSIMSGLAFKRLKRLRAADRFCGDLTYPLYLYHQNIMILALSLTSGYSNTVFAATIIAAFVAAYALHRLVDPLVDRARDRVRGRKLASRSRSMPMAPLGLGAGHERETRSARA